MSKPRQKINEKAQQEFRRNKQLRNSRKKPAKKRSGNRIIYYVTVTALLTAVCAVLSVTVLFNVTDITVSGESRYSNSEIQTASGVEPGVNLVRMDVSEIEKNILDSLIYLDHVRVIKRFPSGLEFEVTAAVPKLSVKHNNEYYLASFSGRVLETKSKPDSNTILITGLDFDSPQALGEYLSSSDESKYNALFQVLATLEDESLTGILSIDITDKLDISLNYQDRIELRIGDSTNLHEKLYVAKSLIDSEIEETQKVILLLSNPRQVVRRLVYEDQAPQQTTSQEESTTEPIENTEPEAS